MTTEQSLQNQEATALGSNPEIRRSARSLLAGKWNQCALASLVYFLVIGAASGLPRIGNLAGFVIGGPMAFGVALFFLRLSRGQEFDLRHLFAGFNDFVRTFPAYLLIVIFVILWALLLIVPGIIAALSYALTWYLLVDNPNMSAMDAIKRSKELMYGYKARLFMLGLSFVGWALLCIPTMGIGFLWLFPYVNTSMALFYTKVLAERAH
jgi:uncharacterized membrane protein